MKVGETCVTLTLTAMQSFMEDQTIGGAITVKIALKNTIFV